MDVDRHHVADVPPVARSVHGHDRVVEHLVRIRILATPSDMIILTSLGQGTLTMPVSVAPAGPGRGVREGWTRIPFTENSAPVRYSTCSAAGVQ